MKKKTRIIVISSVILFFLILYLGFCFAREKYHYLKNNIDLLNEKINVLLSPTKYDYSWMNNMKTYGHAFGLIDNEEYTNSLEAFKKNYENGQKVFEVDLDVTNDYITICSHDEEFWRLNTEINDDVEYTYDNFMSSRIYSRYTPLDYKDLVNLLNEYKDVYFIIDGKYYDKEHVGLEYHQIVSYAKEVDETLLERIIPEIYTNEMLDMIMNVYPFKSIEYCLYQVPYDINDVATFCMDSGVNLVTFDVNNINDEIINYFKAYDINIGLFTINDISQAKEYLDKGVDVICTDVLVHSDLD